MNEYVNVERYSDDRLTQWLWRFWYLDGALWLDFYGEFTRPTRRHGFTRTEMYNRLTLRASTLAESDVVLRADVIEEALKTFRDSIKVRRWSERSKTVKEK